MEYFILLFLPMLLGFFYVPPQYRLLYRILISAYFVVLIFFSGLRWTTGTDWDNYLEYFTKQDNYRSFETGYVLLTSVVKSFSDSYSVFLLIDTAVALIPVWYVLKVENDCHPLSVAVFFSYYFTLNYLGSNRRIISIGICALALLYLRRKKLLPFIALCALSFCFHRSSIIFFLAWPVYYAKPSLKKYLLLIAAAVTVQALDPLARVASMSGAAASNLVLLQRLVDYVEHESLNPNINYGLQNALSIAKRLVFLVLIYWGWSKQSDSVKKEYAGYVNLYVFSFALYLMFTGTVEIFKTATIYFSIVELFLLPVAVASFKRYRPAIYLLFSAMLVAQQYSALHSYWEFYMPYQSVLVGQR